MATTVVVPKLGLTMKQGKIVRWLKREGDAVAPGDKLFEVETEKITIEVESPAAGLLRRVLAPEGAMMPVAAPVAVIAAADEAIEELAPATMATSAAPTTAPAAAASATPAGATTPAAPTTPGERAPITPAARKLAAEHGVDPTTLKGTGPGGRVTIGDVEAAIAARTAPAAQPAPAAARTVTFFSDGLRLAGCYSPPSSLPAGERAPGIVLCPSIFGFKEVTMPDVARTLAAAGFATLALDYRGFGASDGPRHRLIPTEQARDVRAALSWLEQQPEVDERRLGLLGISFGGAHALTAAADDERVAAVVAVEPVTNGARWLRSLRRAWEWYQFEQRLVADRRARALSGQSEPLHLSELMPLDPEAETIFGALSLAMPQHEFDPQLTLECAEAIVAYHPEAAVERIAPRAVLFVHGRDDVLVPLAESQAAYARAGEPKRLALLDGMGHLNWQGPSSPLFGQIMTLAQEWFTQHLRGS